MQPIASEIVSLQAQIVELRLRLDQQGEANAALVRWMVEQEIARVMKSRLPSEEAVIWLEAAAQRASLRAKDYKDLWMHTFKLGTGIAAGWIVLALWEDFKSRVTGR